MWPFTKKEYVPKEPEPEPEPPIALGERFKYLGVEMVCSRHYAWPYKFKVVVAEYITKQGKIEQLVFCPIDWLALEKENAR